MLEQLMLKAIWKQLILQACLSSETALYKLLIQTLFILNILRYGLQLVPTKSLNTTEIYELYE